MTDPITVVMCCGALLNPTAEQVLDCPDWLPASMVVERCEKPMKEQHGWVTRDCTRDGTLCYCRKEKR